MKDELGHGSAAHSSGIQAAVPTAFEVAKSEQARLDKASSDSAHVLDKYPRGPMGLTSPEARATPQWRADKAASDTAFQRLRNFNGGYVKTYAKELRTERANRFK
jgi:hypothetical protein